MRYSYFDLQEQSARATVTVQLAGSSANVLLLDQDNFASYRAGRPFLYTGGFRRRSPTRLTVPSDGHWYVVVDLGGYGGKVRARVEVTEQEITEGQGESGAEPAELPEQLAGSAKSARR